jgi:hypothetical protein
MCADRGDKTAIIELLCDRHVDMDALDNDGHTALGLASNFAHVDVVRVLLSRGANVGAGFNPLYFVFMDIEEEQRKIESIEKKPGELNMDCVQRIRDEVQGNERMIWKRIFPKPAKEVVFYATPQCSFAMMIYIIENVNRIRGGKVSVNITIQNIKTVLWGAYKEYIPTYSDNIMVILKTQGKKIQDLETSIFSEGYILTDLDIWVLATKLKLPIVLFSSTTVKSLMDPTKQIEWVMLSGNAQKDAFYFVRSPTKMGEYQLVITPTELTNPQLKEFYNLVQNAVTSNSEHVTPIARFLQLYKYKTIVRK